jgi:hypothetical protein
MTSQETQVSGIVEAFDDFILAYVLKKLTDVLEELMTVSKRNYPDNMSGVLEMGRVKAAAKIPIWLKRVKYSDPCKVTRLMKEQMDDAHKCNQNLRFEAQVVLLEVLVEGALAMNVACYSEFIGKRLH